MLVEYVGLKPKETDCVAGTGLTWYGAGDVQEVPDKAWPIMAKHPDVWRLVEADKSPKAEPLMAVAAVTDATGRSVTLVAVDGAYTLPAGVVFADAEVAPGLGDAKPVYVIDTPDGPMALDGIEDAKLKAFAAEMSLAIDGRKKGDGLRQAIVDGLAAKAT